MSNHDYIRLPRLYVDPQLTAEETLTLGAEQTHYLKNVMRRKPGDQIRLFNGRDGEWLATIGECGKKSANVKPERQIIAQPPAPPETHLIFTPIKKARMDILVEKAVELGVTHLHPVLSQNTEVRQIKAERLSTQLIEAAEQCERLDVPACAPLQEMQALLQSWNRDIPVYGCIERSDAPPLQDALGKGPAAFLVGPEGGFTETEREFLQTCPAVRPVSLGHTVLRSETAAIYALAARLICL